MMYNRYIPESNGIYRKHAVVVPDPIVEHSPEPICKEQEKQSSCECRQNPCRVGWDLGDLLLLCIVILLLLDSEEEDILPILIAVASFLFIQ